MSKNILVASSSRSAEEYAPVVDRLTHWGHNVKVYNSDRVISGLDSFFVGITPEGGVRLEYSDEDISNDNVDAIWYRKVAEFLGPEETKDKAKALLIQDEVASFHQDIWCSLYDDNKWLNSPSRMIKASNKLGQLVVACRIGFDIPGTVVSSNWGDIQSQLIHKDGYRDIVVKMNRGVIVVEGQELAMPTTLLSEQKINELCDVVAPFPGFYQHYKQKHKEWRVTVVGDDVFAVAIYTADEAKDDWRRHQNSKYVKFKPEEFDDAASEKCQRFLGHYGLKFGAFDFIESSDGSITFLECNANGQYYGFEKMFGMPISDTIARELVAVASQRD